MRIANANLANADLLREIETTFNQLVTKISELEQENAELKNKHKEYYKKPKTTQTCFNCGEKFEKGDSIKMVIDKFASDGAPHAVPCHAHCS